MMVVTLQSTEEHEEDQYTFVGKKGQQKNGNRCWNPEDCNFSWAGLDQCPDGPPSMELWQINWNLKSYHLHNGMRLFRKKAVKQVPWLKGTKHFLPQSGKESGKEPEPEWCSNCRQIISSGRTLKLSQKNSSKIDWRCLFEKFWTYLWARKRAFRIIANHAVAPGSEQLICM